MFKYCSSKKLLTPANILLVNLAFSDLLIILMIPIFIYNSFLQGPAIGGFGKEACYMYNMCWLMDNRYTLFHTTHSYRFSLLAVIIHF